MIELKQIVKFLERFCELALLKINWIILFCLIFKTKSLRFWTAATSWIFFLSYGERSRVLPLNYAYIFLWHKTPIRNVFVWFWCDVTNFNGCDYICKSTLQIAKTGLLTNPKPSATTFYSVLGLFLHIKF